jgi:ABC-type branched-subunit amino acid transport system ATPase component
MLDVRTLKKSFGALCVTNDVSLTVAAGERRVILGPNGAGKTTMFNLLVGELTPTAGSIHLGGEDITRLGVAQRARRGLSRSYQKNTLFDGLTVRQNLALAASVALGKAALVPADSLADRAVAETVAEVAAQVGLTALLDAPIDAVSYGARRQLEVGIALATRPRVLLMDEPTSGVGPEMIGQFHRLLKTLPRELAVVIIEHDMDLAFDVADSVTVLNYGQVVFDGDPEAARRSDLLKEIYLGSWEDA